MIGMRIEFDRLAVRVKGHPVQAQQFLTITATVWRLVRDAQLDVVRGKKGFCLGFHSDVNFTLEETRRCDVVLFAVRGCSSALHTARMDACYQCQVPRLSSSPRIWCLLMDQEVILWPLAHVPLQFLSVKRDQCP
jgi:hypothetical protein